MPYSSPVHACSQAGRTIGFPTVNLDPHILPPDTIPGVYACWVRIDGTTDRHKGALYFGPRHIFNETKTVLEIHILDFQQDLYDTTISFELCDFIRPPLNLSSLEALKKQITTDILAVRESLL